MGLAIASSTATLLVLLAGTGSVLGILETGVDVGQLEMGESSCNTTTYFSVRSAWASEDEPCQQKLPLDMWTFMKAEGSAQDADAQHVFVECMREPEVGLMELLTAMDWNADVFSALPGEIVSESEHAVSFVCKGAEDFEAICDDEDISKASPVVPFVASHGGAPRTHRRLQTTTSEAGTAHQVDELIQGLQDLACLRTTGEDQTICVLSVSFNNLGGAGNLEQSGDLPPVDVVKDWLGTDGSDEGSAMIELAFDIAPGANYKFNSAAFGEQTFADDIGILAGAEQCDVIVDDIVYASEPSFRDGVIASAVDAATEDHDILYFSSAGNSGFGHRFVPDWECQTGLFPDENQAPCTEGVSANVFVPSEPGIGRYFFPFRSTSSSRVFIKLDTDEGSAPEMTMAVWFLDFFFGLQFWSMSTSVVTYSDMMEMLTDYEYTIDATSDAGGAPETFGQDAGYGIMSAQQMCRWVQQNCADTCPGPDSGPRVHGDPHLVGLAGQKFDFTGQSNSWYALLSAWGTDHVNMRVTAPIADLPVVTYITGISVQTEDEDGVGHSIVIFVSDPSVLDSRCPADGPPCIGDGALTVLLDGVSVTSPGEKELGPGVSFVAANIPGECRPFGFERYWQQKVRDAELLANESRRRLSAAPTMDRWIADDASATNPTECKEYVSNALEHDVIFTHLSDHVSFQLITPNLTLRLNHGKLHQLPERDPTDTFEIPDHTTFQMNLGFLGIIRDANMQGIIGETAVPTVDEHGEKIMSGLEAIRGQEEDYKVIGPLGKAFEQLIPGV